MLTTEALGGHHIEETIPLWRIAEAIRRGQLFFGLQALPLPPCARSPLRKHQLCPHRQTHRLLHCSALRPVSAPSPPEHLSPLWRRPVHNWGESVPREGDADGGGSRKGTLYIWDSDQSEHRGLQKQQITTIGAGWVSKDSHALQEQGSTRRNG